MHFPIKQIRMEQRITVKIAEREYVLMSPNEETEEYIRLAAATINKKISGYSAKFPGKNLVDILSFVALNESIGSITLQKKIEGMIGEAKELKKDTDNYLDSIKEK